MKKLLNNLTLYITVMFTIMLIFSFIMWDISWITSNSPFAIFGRIIVLILGFVFSTIALKCKNDRTL